MSQELLQLKYRLSLYGRNLYESKTPKISTHTKMVENACRPDIIEPKHSGTLFLVTASFPPCPRDDFLQWITEASSQRWSSADSRSSAEQAELLLQYGY